MRNKGKCKTGQPGDRRILPSGRAGKRSDEAGIAAFGFTARTYHKVLKVARTIADLDGSQEILKQHLCEAIGYRTPDKKYWKR